MIKLTRSKLIKCTDKIVEVIYLAIIFIVPLYFSVIFPTYNVFELGKLFIFKSLVLILLISTVLRLCVDISRANQILSTLKKLVLRNKKYYLIPIIFIVGLGISVLLSGNITQSFFGSYDRQSGYLSYVYYFIFALLLVINLFFNSIYDYEIKQKTLNSKINSIVRSVVLSGLLVSIYAILQRLGLDFLNWFEAPWITGRSFSTLGQPNFLASWLLLVIPLVFYLSISSSGKYLKSLWILIFVIQVIALFTTGSRGGVIAFLLSSLIVLIYWLAVRKIVNFPRLTKSFILLLLAIIIIITLFFQTSNRWQNLLDFRSGSFAARLGFYEASLDAVIERPIIGYGLDNLRDVFIEHYQVDWGIHSNVAVINDRAHNLLLDFMLAGGLIGLILWAIIYGYFFRLAVKIKKQRHNGLVVSLTVGGGAYLGSLMFNFSFVSGEIYFFLFLAIIFILQLNSQTQNTKLTFEVAEVKKKERVISMLIFLFVLFAAVFLFFYEIRNLRADNYFLKMRYRLMANDYYAADYFFKKIESLKINPINKNHYRLVAADFLSEYCLKADEDIKPVCLDRLRYLENNLLPSGLENIFIKGRAQSALGKYDLARENLEVVSQKSPHWPKSYIELGRLYARSGDLKKALAYYQVVWLILPDINDDRFNDEHRNVLKFYHRLILEEKGDIYLLIGDFEAAEQSYLKAYESDQVNASLLKKISNTYYLRGQFGIALNYVLHGAELFPSDYSWFLQAAILLSEQGELARAIEQLNIAEELAPNNDNLLQFKRELLLN